jgi:chaperone required for assembly of F1-ATPase
MKRFWRDAAMVEGPDGFGIELDGKPVRVPGGARLVCRGAVLARAIAAEWDEAAAEFSLESLRLTRLAATAQERIAADPGPVALALARYAETDLLCYRAAAPVALVERQQRDWQPWLDWSAERLGARLAVTTGVRHLAQSPAALATLAGVVAACDPATLAGLGVLVPALGSLILGLAVTHGALAAPVAFRLSVLDELFQAEQWGEDAEAVTRRAEMAEDVALAARFIELARA